MNPTCPPLFPFPFRVSPLPSRPSFSRPDRATEPPADARGQVQKLEIAAETVAELMAQRRRKAANVEYYKAKRRVTAGADGNWGGRSERVKRGCCGDEGVWQDVARSWNVLYAFQCSGAWGCFGKLRKRGENEKLSRHEMCRCDVRTPQIGSPTRRRCGELRMDGPLELANPRKPFLCGVN